MKVGICASIGAVTAALLMAGGAEAATYVAFTGAGNTGTELIVTTNTATPDQFALEIINPTGATGLWNGAATLNSIAFGDAWSSGTTLTIAGSGISGSIAGVDHGQNSSGCNLSDNAAFVCFTLPSISVTSNPTLDFTITASGAVNFSQSSPPDLKILFLNSNGHINGGGQYSQGIPLCSRNCPTGGVPEPASWAMMLVGVGAIGGALRMRRKTAMAAA